MDFDSITELSSSNGIIVEIMYQTKEIEYTIETTSQDLLDKKLEYQNSLQEYENQLRKDNINYNDLSGYKRVMLNNYKNYLEQLNKLLEQQEGDIL